MIDLSAAQSAALPAWARARISADVECLQVAMRLAGELVDDDVISVALTTETGTVFVRLERTGDVFALEPRTGLLRTSAEGFEALWRPEAGWVYDLEESA